MKQTLKRTIIAGAALALLTSPAVALAKNGISVNEDVNEVRAQTTSPSPRPSTVSDSDPSRDLQASLETELRDQLEQKSEQRQTALAADKTELWQKLDNVKKKACENHAAAINKLMALMDKRRQDALDQVTKIADAVQMFYVKKSLSVANYDDLVTKIKATEAVAEQATQAQQQIPSLDCSGDHPRADVADFKDKRSTSIDAVKAYRDAVRDLVKAVKAATEATQASVSATDGGDQ
jgi:hypothetical protein